MPREKPENQEDQQIPPVNNIAVSTTTMTNQQELDLSSTMPFTTATSTAPSKPQPDLSPPASVTGQKD